MKRDMVRTLRRAAHPLSNDRQIGRGPRKVVLVGHSVVMDLQSLYQSPSLRLDFLGTDVFRMKPTTVFDTLMLKVAAKQQGAKIRWRALGWLVKWLSVQRRYRRFGSVKGCHNAGNDAAYTMMALLMFALWWDRIVPRRKVSPHHEKDERKRKLPSKPHDSTFEGLRSRLEDTKLEEDTPVMSEEHVELMTSSLSTPGASAEAEQEHAKLLNAPLSTPGASAEAEQGFVEPKPLSSSSPSESAKAEQEHIERKPLSLSLPSASAKAKQNHVKRKKISSSTPIASAKAEPSPQSVSAGSSFWNSPLQILTGWWRRQP